MPVPGRNLPDSGTAARRSIPDAVQDHAARGGGLHSGRTRRTLRRGRAPIGWISWTY